MAIPARTGERSVHNLHTPWGWPLLIGVVTCAAYQHRVQAQQETWVPWATRDVRFFDGKTLGVPDDYDALARKTEALCRYALDAGYDRLLKIDDDGWINFRKFKVVEADYAGIRNANYASGGAYWLSRRSMEIIVRGGIDDIAEDRGVGKRLAQHGIPLTELPDYIWQGAGLATGIAGASACPCSECKKLGGKPVWEYFPDAAVITQLGPEAMRACHKFYTENG